MIGTIRKHSKWLWAIIIAATIISFVFFFSPNQRMNRGGGGGSVNLGTLYGHKISQDAYTSAQNEFRLFYLFHYGTWPEKNSVSENDMERETYVRLLLIEKADSLGIYVSDKQAGTEAGDLLRSFGRNGRAVPMDEFTTQVLQPEGLTVTDFENFARHDLVIQQLVQTLGLPGALVTPQEAAAAYSREHQERSTRIVFFSASNYLSQVAVTPAAVTQFYTNYLAAYRLPDRVQVSYVEFNATNFLAQSKAEWAKTNFDEYVDAIYLQNGAQAFPDAKTPAEAKAQIRQALIRRRALADAHLQANDFATAVFNLAPNNPKPENLAAIAKEKGLDVKVTAPFDSENGPQNFSAPESFTAAAFKLTSDIPFAGPILGTNAVYVIALDKKLLSEIPPFEKIRARVTRDFQTQRAAALARRAGTNFVRTLTMDLATGKSFASACVAAGFQPEILPPFSLSTPELPDLGDRVELNQLKQVAFTTPIGRASEFEPTSDGGFIVFVQSQLPVDQSALAADLPEFTARLRRSLESEAFNEWLQVEANRELRDTPLSQQK
ncbi:MAG: SurA N-terminal domain-containing protein [Limisphaerales bacterium]